jgi:hypothetical protein
LAFIPSKSVLFVPYVTESVPMKSSKKKTAFLQQLAQGFNITDSCQKANIGRQNYYRWLDRDPAFKKACNDIEESLIDHVENEMLKQIDKGNSDMIKWFLSHKGKDRGWAEQAIQEHTGSVEIKFTKELVSRDNANQPQM